MERQRKEELSMYYYIRDNLPSIVTMKDGFPPDELVLPTVSVEGGSYSDVMLELGNREGLRERLWSIDVFAKNKPQREDLGELIYNLFLPNQIVEVYDFELGDEEPYPPQIGVLRVQSRNSESIVVFRDLVEKLYWRRRITIVTQYQDIF